MTKAVIFDFDGLLVDTETISYKVYKRLLADYVPDFTLNEYAQNYCGKLEIKNVENMIKKYNLPWTVAGGLNLYVSAESEIFDQGVDLKKGALELLRYLKEHGYKTAIASSSIRERAMKILIRNDVAKYFDDFAFGDEVEHGKPSPDIFLKAAEKLQEKPENCLVLEDSEAGIQASRAAGIPVICVPDLKVPENLAKAAAVKTSLDEVIGYLKAEVEFENRLRHF